MCVKCLFKSFDHCLLGCLSSRVDLEKLCICPRNELLSYIGTMNTFSHFVASLLYFNFLMMSFDEQKLLVLRSEV